MDKQKKNILVIAAHPDDEVLGAGGTIVHHIRKGDTATIAILGEGITSRYPTPGEADRKSVSDLKSDARKAARILGCSDLKLYDLPDNRFDTVALLDIVKIIERLVEETGAEIVYTHYHGDLNIDHVITTRAVLTACRPLTGTSVRRILAFEVPSSTGWSFPEHVFVPTVFVDISETLPLKVEAMKAYRSEVRQYGHPRSPEALVERAKSWGTQVGMKAAEPFALIRELIT